jgi:hypothetical protein
MDMPSDILDVATTPARAALAPDARAGGVAYPLATMAVGLLSLILVAGCPGDTRQMTDAATVPPSAWIDLLPAPGVKQWTVLRGSADFAGGKIVLDGSASDAIICAGGVDMVNGAVEAEVLREDGVANEGPYTFSLRLTPRLFNWRSIYFVCRPGSVEACRASHALQNPSADAKADLERRPRRELWRFIMNGPAIDCYRDGLKVLSYIDPDPTSGVIALTASKCRLTVTAIRYRKATLGDAPGSWHD